jgi:hypothetical protein
MVMEIWVDGWLAGRGEGSLDQPSPENRHWEFPRIRLGRFWGRHWAGRPADSLECRQHLESVYAWGAGLTSFSAGR